MLQPFFLHLSFFFRFLLSWAIIYVWVRYITLPPCRSTGFVPERLSPTTGTLRNISSTRSCRTDFLASFFINLLMDNSFAWCFSDAPLKYFWCFTQSRKLPLIHEMNWVSGFLVPRKTPFLNRPIKKSKIHWPKAGLFPWSSYQGWS